MTAAALLPAEQALAAQRCASCPKLCRGACPTLAVTANERHQPWGHAASAVAAMKRPDGFAAMPVVENAFACATCSACTPPCKVEGVETPDLTWAVRAAVFDAGATPEIGRRLIAEANAGRVLSSVAPPAWVSPGGSLDDLRGLATPGASLLLFPGCGALGRRPAAVVAAARVLAAAGVAFDILEEHRCCGMPALTFGDTPSLRAMLADLAGRLSRRRVLRVAVQSPSCAFLLGVRAPAMGLAMPAAVEPLAATVWQALRGTGRVVSAGSKVAYHDPCYLARHQSVVEEPRATLRLLGYDVRELRGRGDTTACSGQGGGLALTHPAIAAGYLERLRIEVVDAPAGWVVTGCASCAATLDAVTHGVVVQEFSEAVAAALGAG